jgi:dUTP pyrophosphatase
MRLIKYVSASWDLQTGSEHAAAFDIPLAEPIRIGPHEHITISLHVGFEVPELYCLLLYPRSSTFTKHGLLCPTSIIDWDYRGAVHGQAYNMDADAKYFDSGVRLFQAMLVPYEQFALHRTDALTPTIRGTDGLGSSGI